MERLGILILLVMFHYTLMGQDIKVEDFNNDGFEDTLKISTEYGGNYMDREIQVSGGRGTQMFLNKEFSFSSFFDFVLLDDNFFSSQRKPFTTVLGNAMFSSKEAKLSPALDFLLSVYQNGIDSTQNDFSYTYNPKWNDTLESMNNYYCKVNVADVETLLHKANGNQSIDNKYSQVWVLYSGINHKRSKSRTIDYEDGTQLILTAHGVVIKQDKKYSWCFMSDGRLMQGIEKLRFPSIDNAWYFEKENIVIISQDHIPSGGQSLYVVDYKKGKITNVFTSNKKSVNTVKVIDEKLVLGSSESKQPISTIALEE